MVLFISVSLSSLLLSGDPPLSCLVVLPVQAHDLPHSCLWVLLSSISWSSPLIYDSIQSYLMILPTHAWQSSPLLPDSPPLSCHSILLLSNSFLLSSRVFSTACIEPGGSFSGSLEVFLWVFYPLSIFAQQHLTLVSISSSHLNIYFLIFLPSKL